ncbi:spermidine synthase [Nilaparvata lugens]|uniref:spermidine synthase n=1 Tax=Nilaparvata lugens TaxID=108931 RepID=UPI000B996437|nr:spermidine synthase [Nilaparvata lugens]
MDAIKNDWFSELSTLWPGVCLSLEVEKVLHSEKSEFQDIKVLQTKNHGKALILDGIIQCTEYDEFSYQEMISFIPLCSHPSPKQVLIVGGGDGGVAREVVKHPLVEQVTQVEIDARVMEVSKQYLPTMGAALSHPKVNVFVGDGFKFMKEHTNQFDVIITDSSDPIGPAESLFQQSYFELMQSALRPGGVVCSQAGTVWCGLDTVVRTFNFCRSVFAASSYAYSAVPTYPTGQIGYVLGAKSATTNFKEPVRIFSETELEKMELRYYSPEIHRAAFVLPRFAEKALYGAEPRVNGSKHD